MLQAYKDGNEAEKKRLLDEYGKLKTPAPLGVAYQLIRTASDPSMFNRFADPVNARKSSMPAPLQRRLSAFLTAGYMEQGRVRDALRETGPLDNFANMNRWIDQPFYPLSTAQLAEIRDRLLQYDSIPSGTTPDQVLKPHVRLYHLAVVSCRMRDYAAASTYARRMESLETPQPWAKSIRDLGKIVDAQVDLQNGQPNAALQKLDATDVFPPFDIVDVLRFGTSRFLWRAEALYQAGRYQEALGMFSTMPQVFGFYQPHIAYRLLRSAQTNDALRNYDQARLQYSQFLTLFSKPDPEFLPVVNQVRARLAELQRING